MSIQSKVLETAEILSARTLALLAPVADSATARVADATRLLKASLSTLQVAGLELDSVARRHVSRFVKQNAVIAREASMEVTAIARSTYSRLARGGAKPVNKSRPTRKRPSARKQSLSKVA